MQNKDQELREALELFEQLQPRDQLDRLILLLNMPTERQPSHYLDIAQRKDQILGYYADIPDGLQKVIEVLRDLIGKQPPLEDLPDRKHNLPLRNDFFTGRVEIIERIRSALTSGNRAALTQAIGGLGGVGKTQTAIEYAYKYEDEYKHIFWTRAEDSSTLTADFVEMAKRLDLPEKDSKDLNEAVQAARFRLESEDGWLMVMDNVDADRPEIVKPFLPRTRKGHILITSRALSLGSLGLAKPLIIDVMTLDEALDFFAKRTGKDLRGSDEEEPARTLSEELGRLPLALEQAGAYIAATELLFVDYIKIYSERRLKVLGRAKPEAGDYKGTVEGTWLPNFEAVERDSPAAADVLRLSGFLHPDDIPFELLEKGAKEIGSGFSKAVEEAGVINEILKPLMRYSLIRVDRVSKTYAIHRLVQEVVKERMSEQERREWAERTVRAINVAFPSVSYDIWPLCNKLLPQAKEAAKLIDKWGFEFEAAALLLNQAGVYCYESAQYEEAEPLYKRALGIWEKTLGSEHPDTANSLNNLALLYKSQGKYEEAEPLYKRALGIWEKTLGSEHPDTAESLNNLAMLYYSQGKYSEAEPLHKRALGIFEKALGSEHPYTATSLNNLAMLYYSQGKYSEAEPLYKRALGIREKTLGSEHPYTATSLNNLAMLYYLQGKYSEAEPLHKRALDIREKTLGSEHPDTAQSLNNLALLYNSQGKYEEAEPLYKRALGIWEKTLGSEHPETAASLNNLAKLYSSQGKNEEAEPLCKRALGIWKKTLGDNHPNTVKAKKNYNELLSKMGRPLL